MLKTEYLYSSFVVVVKKEEEPINAKEQNLNTSACSRCIDDYMFKKVIYIFRSANDFVKRSAL